MGHPVSVRLDKDIQVTLEEVAKARGIGLSTYLRELAVEEAKRVRRERIRAQSRAVGAYLVSSPEGRAFYAEWGTPTADGKGP
jgi:predicted transcriptional regulator